MIRTAILLGLMLGLGACGADGEPQPPAPKATSASGIRVSGSARVGVSVSQSIVKPYSYRNAGPDVLPDPSGF